MANDPTNIKNITRKQRHASCLHCERPTSVIAYMDSTLFARVSEKTKDQKHMRIYGLLIGSDP